MEDFKTRKYLLRNKADEVQLSVISERFNKQVAAPNLLELKYEPRAVDSHYLIRNNCIIVLLCQKLTNAMYEPATALIEGRKIIYGNWLIAKEVRFIGRETYYEGLNFYELLEACARIQRIQTYRYLCDSSELTKKMTALVIKEEQEAVKRKKKQSKKNKSSQTK